MIGIMLGHGIFAAAFTATSMIGFIALAGIIVRNSIRRGGDPGRPDLPGLGHLALVGLASSTLLTVLVIPAIYVVLRDDGRPLTVPQDAPQP